MNEILNKDLIKDLFIYLHEFTATLTEDVYAPGLDDDFKDELFENDPEISVNMSHHFIFDRKDMQKQLQDILRMYMDSNNYFSKEDYDTVFNNIYVGAKDSYFSIYSIVKVINKNTLLLQDLFLNESITVQHFLNTPLEVGTHFGARLFKIGKDNYIYHLSRTLYKEMAQEVVITIQEHLKASHGIIKNSQSIIRLLKLEAAHLIFIFHLNSLISYSISNEQFTAQGLDSIFHIFFNKKDFPVFREYLDSQLQGDINKLESIFYCLRKYYSNYLEPIEYNYSDINKFNLADTIMHSVKYGVYYTDLEFFHTVTLLKSILEFFCSKEEYKKRFDKPYSEIKDISNNILLYSNILKGTYFGVYTDTSLMNIVTNNAEPIEDSVVSDFDFFSDYVQFENYEFTTYDKTYPSICKELASSMNLKPTSDVRRPTEDHYPYIKLLLYFFLAKNLGFVEDLQLVATENAFFYMSLDYENKLTLWIRAIFHEDFLLHCLGKNKKNLLYDTMVKIVTCASSHKYLKCSEVEISSKAFFVFDILKRLQIITLNNDLGLFKLTNLGKEIRKYYFGEKNSAAIIDIFEYKKKNNEKK